MKFEANIFENRNVNFYFSQIHYLFFQAKKIQRRRTLCYIHKYKSRRGSLRFFAQRRRKYVN